MCRERSSLTRSHHTLIAAAMSAFGLLSFPERANATVFDLPLDASIEITGNISTPISITMTATAQSILPIPPPPYIAPFAGNSPAWVYDIQVSQSDGNGGFTKPQACVAGGGCFSLLGFEDCGADLGCGFQVPAGYGILRNGSSGMITVSDSTRDFEISTSTTANIPFTLILSVDLPDGFGVDVQPLLRPATSDFEPNLKATPLPTALPLFATGLAALCLVGRRRKRRAAI